MLQNYLTVCLDYVKGICLEIVLFNIYSQSFNLISRMNLCEEWGKDITFSSSNCKINFLPQLIISTVTKEMMIGKLKSETIKENI